MIPKLKLQGFLILGSLSAGWLLLMSPAAIANSWPPMAVPLFYLPLVASVVSFGIGLFLIILLEAWTLVQRENLEFWRSIRLVIGANLLSTLAGFGVVMALTLALNDVAVLAGQQRVAPMTDLTRAKASTATVALHC